MTKADVQNYQIKYNMEILCDPITREAHGVMCESIPAIPELDELANKVEWGNPPPNTVVVERQWLGEHYRYIIHCPTSWFDLWGWKE